MKFERLLTCLPLLLFSLAACEGDDAQAAAPIVRDSAGIQIIENTAPAWREGAGWRVAEAPTVDIGMIEGDPDYQLYDVSGAVRLSDGRVVVANGGSRELRFYSSEGRHLQTAGGEGDGPGEFRSLGWVGRLSEDSVAAWDPRQKRLSVFAPDGSFARSFQLEGLTGVFPDLEGVLDGSLVVTPGLQLGVEKETGRIRRDSVLYLRFDRSGALVDTLGRFPGRESVLIDGDWGSSDSDVVFGRSGHIALGEGGFWFGDNATYEVVRYSSAPEMVRLVRRAHEPVRVDEGDVARYHELRGDNDFSGAPPQMRALLEQRARAEREQLPHRATLPAFADLRADAEGYLWVERSRTPGDTQPRWDVFDPGGRWLGTVETPPGLKVLHIGPEWILGQWQDEFGVEHVRKYPLIKP